MAPKKDVKVASTVVDDKQKKITKNGKIDEVVTPQKNNDRGKPVESEQIVDRGFVDKKDHERLPVDWLHRWTQKHKLEKPQYHQFRCRKPGMFKFKITIPNLKNRDKDIVFVTKEEFPFELWAKNMTAMVLLFHFEPLRPYEKMFPEPYGSTWKSLSSPEPLISSAKQTATVHEEKLQAQEAAANERIRLRRLEMRGILSDRVLPRIEIQNDLQVKIFNLLSNICRVLQSETNDAKMAYKSWTHNSPTPPAVFRDPRSILLPFSDALSALEGSLGGPRGFVRLAVSFKGPSYVVAEAKKGKKSGEEEKTNTNCDALQQSVVDNLFRVGISEGYIRTALWALQQNILDLKHIMETRKEFSIPEAFNTLAVEDKDELRRLTVKALSQWCIDFLSLNVPFDALPPSLSTSTTQMTVASNPHILPNSPSSVSNLQQDSKNTPITIVKSGMSSDPIIKSAAIQSDYDSSLALIQRCASKNEEIINAITCLHDQGFWGYLLANNQVLQQSSISSLKDFINQRLGGIQGDVNSDGFTSLYSLTDDFERYSVDLSNALDEVRDVYGFLSTVNDEKTKIEVHLGEVTLPLWNEVDRCCAMMKISERELIKHMTGAFNCQMEVKLILTAKPLSSITCPDNIWMKCHSGGPKITDAVMSRALTKALKRDLMLDSEGYDCSTTLSVVMAGAQVAFGMLSSASDFSELVSETVREFAEQYVSVDDAMKNAGAIEVNPGKESKVQNAQKPAAPSTVAPSSDKDSNESDTESVASVGKSLAEVALGDGGVVGENVFESSGFDDSAELRKGSEVSILSDRIRRIILASKETEVSKGIVNSLPSRQIAESIKSVVRENRVVFIRGETGSGKTTQVPRLIMEDCAERSEVQHCHVICSQPRRLAATSVAARVAEECGVPVGGLVGHHVRYDCQKGENTRLVFVTHGILIRMLSSALNDSECSMNNVTHIVIDEVHERSVDVDLLLLMLARSVCLSRTKFKVVLMSASIDIEAFTSYFNATFQKLIAHPSLIPKSAALIGRDALTTGSSFIPGRTFPVTRTYAYEIVRSVLPDVIRDQKALPKSVQQYLTRQTEDEKKKLMATVKKNDNKNNANKKGSNEIDDVNDEDAAGKAEFDMMAKMLRQQHAEEAANAKNTSGDLKDEEDDEKDAANEQVDEEELRKDVMEEEVAVGGMKNGLVNDDKLHDADVHVQDESFTVDSLTKWIRNNCVYFISRLVEHAHLTEKKDGSILIFVQGTAEIDQVIMALQRGDFFSNPNEASKLHLVPCHAQLPREKQALAFKPGPSGMRKVVVATNVAETSITIDDVTVVIDTGLQKSMQYDGHSRTNELTTCFISQSSAQQRAGRAGRVRAGKCYSLLSEDFLMNGLPANEEPEICRVSLESHALLVKRMFPDEQLSSIFNSCVTPPKPSIVSATASRLKSFAALDGWERLTPWGLGLSELPLEVPIARAVLLGTLLGCGGPVLAAAASAQEHIGLGGLKNREKMQAALLKASSSIGAACDFMAKAALIEEASQQSKYLNDFCLDNGLNLQKVKQAIQLHQNLVQAVASSSVISALLAIAPQRLNKPSRSKIRQLFNSTATRKKLPSNNESSNVPHHNEVRAAIAAGIAPQIAASRWTPRFAETAAGAQLKEPDAKEIKYSVPVNDPLQCALSNGKVSLMGFRAPVESIFVHPSSVSFKYANSKFLVAYLSKLKTTKLFMECTTRAPSTAVLLGAADLEICVEYLPKADGKPSVSPRLVVDGWHDFKCAGAVGSILRQLRSAMWTAKLSTISERAGMNSCHLSSGVGASSSWRETASLSDRQRVIDTVLSALRIEEGNVVF